MYCINWSFQFMWGHWKTAFALCNHFCWTFSERSDSVGATKDLFADSYGGLAPIPQALPTVDTGRTSQIQSLPKNLKSQVLPWCQKWSATKRLVWTCAWMKHLGQHQESSNFQYLTQSLQIRYFSAGSWVLKARKVPVCRKVLGMRAPEYSWTDRDLVRRL